MRNGYAPFGDSARVKPEQPTLHTINPGTIINTPIILVQGKPLATPEFSPMEEFIV